MASGANFKLYFKEQSAQGTAATGNYYQVPCYSFDLGAEEGLQDDPILSANASRDAGDPFLDNPSVTGTAQIPVDPISYGWWMKLLFGAPTTTTPSAGNYSHSFVSGKPETQRPYYTFIKAFPDVGIYERYIDVRGNTLSLDTTNSGRSRATVGLVGVTEESVTNSAYGTAQIITDPLRGLAKGGWMRRNGVILGDVTRFSFEFSNNLEAQRNIHVFVPIDGYDDGLATVTGGADIRLKDLTISAQALASQACSLEYSLTIGEDRSIGHYFNRVFFSRTKRGVSGPGAVVPSYTWRGSNDGSVASMMQVVVNNGQSAY